MHYRKTTIYEQEDATTPKTETIDLDLSEIISRLSIKYNATNSQNDPTAHPAAQVSRVEIVDGSDVLYSLTARQIEALMFYNTGKSRGRILEYRNGNENFMVLNMMFGRYLWDPILALDPRKFKNPQLKVTHNLESGGSLPDASTMEVFADVFDEKPVSPIGFIMPKEYFSWTTVSAAANKYIDLPNDYPIKRIGIETFKAGAWWDNIVTEVELDEENKKRLPWSIDGYDLMMLIAAKYGNYFENLYCMLGSAAATMFYITPEEEVGVANMAEGTDQDVYHGSITNGCQVEFQAAGATQFRAIVSGPYPHGFMPLDCGIQNDHDDWFDVTKKGKVKLRVKAGGAADIKIVLEQLRKY